MLVGSFNHTQGNTSYITHQTRPHSNIQKTLTGAYGPGDCYNCSLLPYNPLRTPNQHLFLQSRYGRYSGIGQAFLYSGPMSEQRSTEYALLGQNKMNTDRQLLSNGVAGGRINRGEFHTLARYQQETEFLRARLREGGYSPREVQHLESRMSAYRNMHQAFMDGDYQIPVYNNGSASQRNLDKAYGAARNSGDARPLLHSLNWYSDNAYAAGIEQRQGPVFSDERPKARVRGQEYRNQRGITNRQPTFGGPRPPSDRTGGRVALDKLNAGFDRLDRDRNGAIDRAELRAIISNPQAYGMTGKEAAALYQNGERIANIDQPGGNWNESISRGDVSRPRGAFSRAADRASGNERRRDNVELRIGSVLSDPTNPTTSGSLFGPTGRPDPHSIQQNREGSCWLLAGMSLLKPEQIQQMVSTNDKGQVVVQFPGRQPELVAPLTDAERRIYSSANGDWSAYLEKAAAQTYQKEGRDINGGWGRDAMQLLTGRGGQSINMRERPQPGQRDARDPAVVHQILSETMARGGMVIAGTSSNDFERNISNLQTDGHAYAVVGYDPQTGTVTLRNPWGKNEGADRDWNNDGTFTMSVRDFQVTFTDMDVQYPKRRGLFASLGQKL